MDFAVGNVWAALQVVPRRTMVAARIARTRNAPRRDRRLDAVAADRSEWVWA